ncbi:MAG: hypothetical protein DSO07_05200 [Thermoproteota archaeon]|nr:MAG: hypothetical protein DSO07_05200 [Candidatus Korarchaeota archaeon]
MVGRGMTKIEWKHIKVPDFVHEKLKQMSAREKRAIWQVVYDSFTYYEMMKKRPLLKSALPTLDKASWYIAKLSQAVTWYIVTQSDENYQLTVKTVSDIGSRLGVRMDTLLGALEIYRNTRRKTSKHRAMVLKALKETVASIILRISEEEKKEESSKKTSAG